MTLMVGDVAILVDTDSDTLVARLIDCETKVDMDWDIDKDSLTDADADKPLTTSSLIF